MAPATTSRSSQSLDTSAERRAFIPSPVPTEDGPTTVQNKPSALQEFFKRNQGLFIIAASQFFFSLMNLSVKFLTALDDPVPTLEVVAIRMFITYVCCQVYMFIAGVPDPILGPKGVRKWLVIRGVVGYVYASSIALYSYNNSATAVSWKQAVAGLASLAGVVLIAKPTSLFGGSDRADTGAGAGGPVVTEAERMVAVGYVLCHPRVNRLTR
ncbi:hypothetical protein AG1IA_04631 [Rhizoctonia solani AG-1 IA]|uniref:Uncharacterized protein n=1 Tax=Thanatephorus cucumeris (strain AG1-IA) TaxID=983506 RepID=L8WTB4_THACA|nr:hypothetical protein AG1IA_04631 [Rhizoctonia solani AG-1 IA]